MNNIFKTPHTETLRRFLSLSPLLVFDYDGTLAPITSDRNRARMRPSTVRRFKELARVAPCYVLTGRSIRDVSRYLKGISVRGKIGNHGMEWRPPLAEFTTIPTEVQKWKRVLTSRLCDVQGIDLEDKRFSLSVHYRASRNRRAARKRVLEVIRELSGCRAVPGKLLFNLTSIRGATKGDAVLRLRRRLGNPNVLFVGDDYTDEDVFAIGNPNWLLTLLVGSRQGSRAQFQIPAQKQIDSLLSLIIQAQRSNLP